MTAKHCLSAAVVAALISGLLPAPATAAEPPATSGGSTPLRAAIDRGGRSRIQHADRAGRPARP